ncbi:hypothetical protein HMPREF0083_01533 [Aneurinibacillus aneurinilyticus ATCC 12856]|uniref:Uncharacterized protein n=1 Tax=Aneurinibacillus aneurinilyticus ATCC 12856 TaxID=649747 RepID=U1YHX0_ANEAE|nr:hypothetical protein HMPREF0083_01533 [Aneurinibacillus aneurinilyticus ATCC 12856]
MVGRRREVGAPWRSGRRKASVFFSDSSCPPPFLFSYLLPQTCHDSFDDRWNFNHQQHISAALMLLMICMFLKVLPHVDWITVKPR